MRGEHDAGRVLVRRGDQHRRHAGSARAPSTSSPSASTGIGTSRSPCALEVAPDAGAARVLEADRGRAPGPQQRAAISANAWAAPVVTTRSAGGRPGRPGPGRGSRRVRRAAGARRPGRRSRGRRRVAAASARSYARRHGRAREHRQVGHPRAQPARGRSPVGRRRVDRRRRVGCRHADIRTGSLRTVVRRRVRRRPGVPEPRRATSRPSATSCSYAVDHDARDSRRSAARSRLDGSRVPGASRPSRDRLAQRDGELARPRPGRPRSSSTSASRVANWSSSSAASIGPVNGGPLAP